MCLEIIRLLLYAGVGVLLFSVLSGKKEETVINYQSNLISPETGLINKTPRGVFPPFSDNPNQILGRWRVGAHLLASGVDSEAYHYELEFKRTGYLYLTRTSCLGDLKLRWRIYYNNIVIEPEQVKPDSLAIENAPEDELCIRNNHGFHAQLQFAAIWTIKDSCLYLLLQDQHGEGSLLIL